MPTPQLSSTQESALEELMQKSFGAQFLYAPKLYKRGRGVDEPCDLFWFGNNVLVLFYLTSGGKPLRKQDEHNLKQARRWTKYWRSQPDAALEGKNRFGDEGSVTYPQARSIVNILVTGHDTGIVFHKSTARHVLGFTCTIPERLIHAIASFNGTVIDLLEVVFEYSKNLRRHIINHTTTGPDRLTAIVARKTSQFRETISNNKFSADDLDSDFFFIKGILDSNRLPDPFGNALSGGGNPRELMASFFSDLSARDYLILALTAKEAIRRTNGGKITVTASTNGLFLDWVIIATELNLNNRKEVDDASEAALVKMNRQKSPRIIYGHPREFADYRSPMMMLFPEKKSLSQANHLIIHTTKRLDIVFAI